MIYITKPITCNGQPVEVLTGWVKASAVSDKCCLVFWDHWYTTMDPDGEIIIPGEDHAVFTATNTAPAPNLVGRGDVVTFNHLPDRTLTVKAICGDYLWCHIDSDGFTTLNRNLCLLNGRPIEGVKP